MDVFVVENLEKNFFSPHHIRPLLCWILSSVPERPGLTAPVTGQALRRAHSWRGLWADPALPLPFPLLQVILPSPPESSFPLLRSHPPLCSGVILPSAPESSSPLLRSHPSHSSRVILPSAPESSFPLLGGHPSHSSGVILPSPPESSSPLLRSHPSHSSRVILPTPSGSSFPLLQNPHRRQHPRQWGFPSMAENVTGAFVTLSVLPRLFVSCTRTLPACSRGPRWWAQTLELTPPGLGATSNTL